MVLLPFFAKGGGLLHPFAGFTACLCERGVFGFISPLAMGVFGGGVGLCHLFYGEARVLRFEKGVLCLLRAPAV